VWHLAQKAGAAQASLRCGSQQDSVEAADVAVLQELQFEAFEFLQAFRLGGGTENARCVLRPWRRR
jgi:hypothetical protein